MTLMRRSFALALILALPSAALWDPFVHAHFDGDHATEHHEGRVVHGHAGSHQIDGARRSPHPLFVTGEEDEDARSITTFIAKESGVARPVTAIAAAVPIVAAPAAAIVGFASFPIRNHDPPRSRTDRPRAPPA